MNHFIGRDVGRYHIIEPLGEGGMAAVYKAYDTRLERDVAIKFIRLHSIPPDQKERLLIRFDREAKRMAKFTHPNIVAIIDYGEYEGVPYLVMPFLAGGTLKEKLKALGVKPMPYQEAAGLLAPVARALEYAHEQDTIHRDVKPANILLTNKGQPMLTDFGVAKILDVEEGQTLTGTGVGVGTPKYMAPEQWKNQVTERTDIYALGVVFFEMVTGRVPYDAETPAGVLEKQLTEPLPRPRVINPILPEEVERVLFKALAKDPQERYNIIGVFAKALERLAQESVVESSEPSTATVWGDEGGAGVTQRVASVSGVKPAKGKAHYGWLILGGMILIVMLGILTWEAALLLDRGGGGFLTFRGSSTQSVATKPIDVSINQNANLIPSPVQLFEITPDTNAFHESRKDKGEMAYVPAGIIQMGSEDGEADERPVHAVDIDGYWIDKTEVTNGNYTRCVADGSCSAPHVIGSFTRTSYYGNSKYVDYPVINVDWEQSRAYCAWAGGRLPSESEWEKAARGTDERTFSWGEGIDCGKANYRGKNGEKHCVGDTTKVGSYPSGASPYGLLDMTGNVWEWVNDWYVEDYYSNSPGKNPPGPSSGKYHVWRGGSWDNVEREVRAAGRGRYYRPGEWSPFLGFRCIRYK